MDFIVPSSGTTGAPKKVVIPESAFMALAEIDCHDLEINSESVILLESQSTRGLICQYRARAAGATLACYPGMEKISLRNYIIARGVTHLAVDATTFRWLCAGAYRFRSVLCVEVGGEMVDWGDVNLCRERFPHAVFHNRYAATEARIIARKRIEPWTKSDWGAGRMPVGKPLKGVTVKIANDGEIIVQSPMLATGYYNDPELTAAKFKSYGYHTGDLGSWDSNGDLRVHGRMALNEGVVQLVKNPAFEHHHNLMLSALHGGEVK